jgi:hypothetical protein
MRIFVALFSLSLLLSSVAAQTRSQAVEEFNNLKKSDKTAEKIILSPDKQDFAAAENENAQVFRILPREKYDRQVLNVRGGGAYYSFTNKSHSYDDTPQIELQRNNLSVGFYGASFGLIADLGHLSLADIERETKGVDFLVNYRPPLEEAKARSEYYKIAGGFEIDGVTYKKSVPVAVGHSYVLRAISFDKADALVAFNVYRRDADGSLIIFWKPLENFEKPQLARNQ